MITGQLLEPLTSAREININVNEFQGTLVQSEYTPTQPESVRKDPGSSSPPLYSMNLTMRIRVLKSNMVETTLLPIINEYY